MMQGTQLGSIWEDQLLIPEREEMKTTFWVAAGGIGLVFFFQWLQDRENDRAFNQEANEQFANDYYAQKRRRRSSRRRR